MATYFEATEATHLALLPSGLRESTDLALIASEAEADVIAHYTRRLSLTSYSPQSIRTGWWDQATTGGDDYTTPEHPYTDLGDGRGVFLRYYVVDADDLDPAVAESPTAAETAGMAFRTALRASIARVIVWRIYQAQRDLPATSQSDGQGKSRSWNAGHDAPFPRDFDRDLRVYDTRTPAWGM